MTENVDILIVGSGSTGLGAAWRLKELRERKLFPEGVVWKLFEKSDHIGGAAASQVDEYGFIWDRGSHVIYSRYKYFDVLLQTLMGDNLQYVERKGWVWFKETFVPYPLQENLQLLSPEFVLECIKDAISQKQDNEGAFVNFKEFVTNNFGRLLAEEFFIPYTYKMFGYPPEDLSVEWTALASGSKHSNVPRLDIPKLIKNILLSIDAPGWINSDKYPYPIRGGSGQIWEALYHCLPKENINLDETLIEIDADNRLAKFSSGKIVHYEYMISTLPLPELLKLCSNTDDIDFKITGAHFIGLGFQGKQPEMFDEKMWIYDANKDSPYFRLSFPANYSQYNVPVNTPHWSVLCEISESEKKHVNQLTLLDDVKKSLEKDFKIDMSNLVTNWHSYAKYAYAVPSHGRNNQLNKYDKWLRERNIYSRGRFGNWKYECGNQDSSFMQGVEAIDNILFGAEELTHHSPELIGKGIIDRTIAFGDKND